MPRCSGPRPQRRRVRAAEGAAGPHPPRAEARLRPRRRVQPRPAVPGTVPMTPPRRRPTACATTTRAAPPPTSGSTSSPSARPTCARWRPGWPRPSPAAQRAGDRLRHRLVDAAWRARGRVLAGHRPEPRDDGRGPHQAAARLRALRRGRRLHAGRPGRRSASAAPSPAAGGATCRWRAWRRWLDTAACAAGTAARAWCFSTTRSCRPAARRCRAAMPTATPTSSARWTTARCTRC